ncbi:MAG TPA: hypothetical protein VEK80_10965, partial [Kribbellaceae bacterium]|nr:hypothetical protein [Kribbellaceae bacterium]
MQSTSPSSTTTNPARTLVELMRRAPAAATGVVLGIAAAAAARPLLEAHLTHGRSGGFRVFPVALAGLAGLALATG